MMKIFMKGKDERQEDKLKQIIPLLKKIKFFAQRDIGLEDYFELGK
jgi:hypothetical protein